MNTNGATNPAAGAAATGGATLRRGARWTFGADLSATLEAARSERPADEAASEARSRRWAWPRKTGATLSDGMQLPSRGFRGARAGPAVQRMRRTPALAAQEMVSRSPGS